MSVFLCVFTFTFSSLSIVVKEVKLNIYEGALSIWHCNRFYFSLCLLQAFYDRALIRSTNESKIIWKVIIIRLQRKSKGSYSWLLQKMHSLCVSVRVCVNMLTPCECETHRLARQIKQPSSEIKIYWILFSSFDRFAGKKILFLCAHSRCSFTKIVETMQFNTFVFLKMQQKVI